LSFNIVYIPRNQNEQVDSLAVEASTFKPPFPPKMKYEVEVRYRPSIPDNVKHWRVFEEDSEIKRFIEAIDDFSSIHIDQDEDLDEDNQNLNFHNMIVGHKILQFPTNHIPKGLVPLERIFYHNDVPVKLPDPEKEAEVTDCNLGTVANPKHVKLSKFLSAKYRAKYEELLKEFIDVFSWKYEDLRTFDETIIQHKIPLKENVKPFKQKLRQINPLLLPIMEKEVKKILDAKIIVPLRYFDWIENMVPVRKKNGEIRLCVDFRNLNRCSQKDNYPLPKMEHILQRVVGSSRMSMIEQEKLLGHIICADGVKIDHARVIDIQKIYIHRTKKEIQSFLGKINSLIRFIPNFVELVKHITGMLKKGSEIKWRTKDKYYFQSIKPVILDDLVLIRLDFEKEFLIFSFEFQDTLVASLL
jgi:hypothetical protein